jgi:hypothetical protein
MCVADEAFVGCDLIETGIDSEGGGTSITPPQTSPPHRLESLAVWLAGKSNRSN